jgi:hypothetical protein
MRRITAITVIAVALSACAASPEENTAQACVGFWEAVQKSAGGEWTPERAQVQLAALGPAGGETGELLGPVADGADELTAAVAAGDPAALSAAVTQMSQACDEAGF